MTAARTDLIARINRIQQSVESGWSEREKRELREEMERRLRAREALLPQPRRAWWNFWSMA